MPTEVARSIATRRDERVAMDLNKGVPVPHRHAGLRDEGLASTIPTATTACADEVIALVQVASTMVVTIISWVAASK